MQPIFVVISDYTRQLQHMQISERDHTVLNTKGICTEKKRLKRLKLDLDGITFFYFIREILSSERFRLRFLGETELLWIQLTPNHRETMDYQWNKMVSQTLWERIEVEYLMSWLSTLGGGFSALGEQFTKFAETAGRISLSQLSIGLRLGDPFLQARCKLFYSISLIQTGKLRMAKYLIREQYKFAIAHKESDSRLVKMCRGIFLRLQYEYQLRANSLLQQNQKT